MCIPGAFQNEGWSDEAFQNEAFTGGAAGGKEDFLPEGRTFVLEGRKIRSPGGRHDGGGGGMASLSSTPKDNFEERKKKRREKIETKQRAARLAREKVRWRVSKMLLYS